MGSKGEWLNTKVAYLGNERSWHTLGTTLSVAQGYIF